MRTNRLVRAFAVVAALGLCAQAHADHWESKQAREAFLAQKADELMTVGRASAHTVRKVNEFLNPGSRIPDANVRITDYAGWRALAERIGPHVVGGAATPHEGGPHLYLVAGTELRDSIDRSSPATFHGTDRRTRSQWLGSEYWYPRVFMLWKAPESALATVGKESERIVVERACEGYNCGVFMARTLGKQGAADGASPFHLNRDLMNLKQPGWTDSVAKNALHALGNRSPDLVIQVLPHGDFQNVQQNWENHEIGFYY
jgi:hypothetical protein